MSLDLMYGAGISLVSVIVSGFANYLWSTKTAKNDSERKKTCLTQAIKSEIEASLIQAKSRNYLDGLLQSVSVYPSEKELENFILQKGVFRGLWWKSTIYII